MSEEKKSEITKEVKEARELTEKELAQVSGGVLPDGVLPGNDKIGIIGEEYSLVGELPAL